MAHVRDQSQDYLELQGDTTITNDITQVVRRF